MLHVLQNFGSPYFEKFHQRNPYFGFNHKDYKYELDGWDGTHGIFSRLLKKHRPHTIVEVGSWKGMSAITMAKEIRKIHKRSTVICVDTWLGSTEFWQNKSDNSRYGSLKLHHGYPTVYYQFLANVVYAGVKDYVVPLPLPSLLASRLIAQSDIQVDMIYLDGDHSEESVYQDLHAWYPIVKDGVMFGHDIDNEDWPGVALALNRFCKETGLCYKQVDHFWILERCS